MKKYLWMSLICVGCSLLSVWAYSSYLQPKRAVWSDNNGESRYASLVEKLFTSRAGNAGASAPTDFTEAAELATPAVVNIKALVDMSDGLFSGGTTGSSGSGVILTPDGYIVTNHHVVENSSDIRVTLSDKREYKAKLIGSDVSTDIALLKIDEVELPFMVFGNSDSIRVGEWVLAVGNPFNLESTVTAGIVSAKGRNINILGGGSSIESFIQTDAAVNPGNSGGALVNTAGELIGVNTAIITESGSYEGYSFAVPSDLVQKIIRDLREFGTVQRAYLGIGIQDLDAETAKDLDLPNAEGVLINRITQGGAAEDAALQVGDVIISVNSSKVRSTAELQEYVGRFRPGEAVQIEYWHGGKKMRSSLVLRDGNNSTKLVRYHGNELEEELGFALRELTRDEKRRMHVQGAMVASVRRGSVVFETNMQPGFVISSVNGDRINSMPEAIDAIKSAYNSLSLDGYYEGEPDLYSYRFRKRH